VHCQSAPGRDPTVTRRILAGHGVHDRRRTGVLGAPSLAPRPSRRPPAGGLPGTRRWASGGSLARGAALHWRCHCAGRCHGHGHGRGAPGVAGNREVKFGAISS
jgi:hypothetical protein